MPNNKKKQQKDQECRICGCSQNDPCYHSELGRCSWVEPDLCSHCKILHKSSLVFEIKCEAPILTVRTYSEPEAIEAFETYFPNILKIIEIKKLLKPNDQ